MEEDEPFEPGDEITFWVVVAKDVGAPEGWEAIVTLPLSDGSKATAVFLSAGTADPVLRRIEEENPDRDVGATPHGSTWLIEALEHRTDIDSVLVNAASVVTMGAAPAATTREDFIKLLRTGEFNDFLRRS